MSTRWSEALKSFCKRRLVKILGRKREKERKQLEISAETNAILGHET